MNNDDTAPAQAGVVKRSWNPWNEKSQTWKNLESSLAEAVACCDTRSTASRPPGQLQDLRHLQRDRRQRAASREAALKMHGGKVPGARQPEGRCRRRDEEVEIYTGYAKTAREEGFADLADFFEGAPPSRRAMRTAISCSSSASRERRVFRRKEEGVVLRLRPHRDRHRARKCPVCEHPRFTSRSRPRTSRGSVRPDGTNGTADAAAPTGACPLRIQRFPSRPQGRSAALQAGAGTCRTSLAVGRTSDHPRLNCEASRTPRGE